jgi:hypothetical protein
MNEPESIDLLSGQGSASAQGAEQRPRAVGSPLSMGASRRSLHASADSNTRRLTPPPPGRALGGASTPADEQSSAQRAMSALRSALPFVQRLLPLLDGNFATAIANLITSHAHPPAPPPPPKLDLAPIEDGLSSLQAQHKNLRDQMAEQNTSLKRVEDQLEMVREATDRNTLEQQELLEDLKAFGNTVRIFAIVTLGLVAVGFFLTLALFLHIQRVLP